MTRFNMFRDIVLLRTTASTLVQSPGRECLDVEIIPTERLTLGIKNKEEQ